MIKKIYRRIIYTASIFYKFINQRTILANKNMVFGDGFVSGQSFRCETIDYYLGKKYNPKIIFGNNVHIEDFVHIGCTNKIEIGDNTVIASKVYISDHNHGYYDENHFLEHENPSEISPLYRKLTHDSEVIIGKNVWIGENVTILSDTYIGDGVIISANSVIKGKVEAYTIVSGMPLRVIKKYSFENKRWERV